jgi:glycosyltransferase involved in cell wall biosynthesis
MPIVLCVLPLSDPFKKAIEPQMEGSVEYMPMAAVKPKGPIAALRFLARQRTEAVYIAFEGTQEMITAPIICILSFIIRAPRRFMIGPDGTTSSLGALDLVKAVLNVIVGSVAAVKSGIVASIELSLLQRSSNAPPPTVKTSRVVYLSTNVSLAVKAGGSLGHIAGVVNDLHRRGFDLTYVATRRFSVIDQSVPMRTLTMPKLLGVPMDLFIFGFSQHIYRQLRGMFVSATPTVLYQRMSRSDYTGAKLSRRNGVPLIMEYNGSEAWGARHWGHPMLFERLARKAELVSLRAAHTVVTISDVLADELVEIGIPKSRIVVYPNCVDSTVFDSSRFKQATIDALRSRHGIPPDATVLGFIGTFGKWHGVDVLCAAIKQLVAERSAWLDQFKVRFLIVGDGFLGRFVAELISDEGPGKYVSWPGLVEQSEGPAYLAAMDILLSPHIPNPDGSRFFGSPTKLFEYMSMCRPIVASRLDQIEQVLSPALSASGLPEQPADAGSRELAILAEPGSVPELIKAIEFAVERRDWREILARNARQEVVRKYQWSHHVDKIIAGSGLLSDPSQASG